MELSFKTKEHPEAVTVQWELPESLEALVAKYGEESVFENAKANYVIGAQAYGRRHIEKPQDELQALFDNYDPTTRSPATKKTAFERATSAVSQMTPEERAELLARLQQAA